MATKNPRKKRKADDPEIKAQKEQERKILDERKLKQKKQFEEYLSIKVREKARELSQSTGMSYASALDKIKSERAQAESARKQLQRASSSKSSNKIKKDPAQGVAKGFQNSAPSGIWPVQGGSPSLGKKKK
jgi:hypothetical protein